MNRHIIILLLTAILSLTLGSCRSGSDVRPSATGEWVTATIPVKVRLLKPQRISPTGRVSMVRGKSISVSLRMMGIEVASAYVDADTVVLVDRYNKRYFASSYLPVLTSTGLDVASLQDVLMGYYPAMPPGHKFIIGADFCMLDVAYSQPAESGGYRMAGRVDLQYRGRPEAQAVLLWQPAKAKWNHSLKVSPPQTDGMTRVTIDDLDLQFDQNL